MSPAIAGGPIGLAIKVATALAAAYLDKEADTIRGATGAVQDEEGIGAAPFNAGGNALFGNDVAPFKKIYARMGDMHAGTKDAIGTTVSELWDGAGFGRSGQQASRHFWQHQRWKHPEVAKAQNLIGEREAVNVRRSGMNYGGWKDLGIVGG
jgi:hypothetical protein